MKSFWLSLFIHLLYFNECLCGRGSLNIHYPLDLKMEGFREGNLTYNEELAKKNSLDPSTYTNQNVAHAQHQEDIWLYENWFYGMENGIILESGGLDGDTYSTSYLFSINGGWHTIHIEGDSGNFLQLKENRQDAINVHAALCEAQRELHYASSKYSPEATRGIFEFMSENFRNTHYRGVHVDSLPVVPCVTVTQVLAVLAVKHIDIWVLDVEGAEELVLQGTDFSKVHINAINMECDALDKERDTRKEMILKEQGFTCERIGANCMCIHSLYKPSKKPL